MNKNTWKLEITLPDNIDINDRNNWQLYPMDLMLKIVDIIGVIEPTFKRHISSRAEWIESPSFVSREYNEMVERMPICPKKS